MPSPRPSQPLDCHTGYRSGNSLSRRNARSAFRASSVPDPLSVYAARLQPMPSPRPSQPLDCHTGYRVRKSLALARRNNQTLWSSFALGLRFLEARATVRVHSLVPREHGRSPMLLESFCVAFCEASPVSPSSSVGGGGTLGVFPLGLRFLEARATVRVHSLVPREHGRSPMLLESFCCSFCEASPVSPSSSVGGGGTLGVFPLGLRFLGVRATVRVHSLVPR